MTSQICVLYDRPTCIGRGLIQYLPVYTGIIQVFYKGVLYPRGFVVHSPHLYPRLTYIYTMFMHKKKLKTFFYKKAFDVKRQ